MSHPVARRQQKQPWEDVSASIDKVIQSFIAEVIWESDTNTGDIRWEEEALVHDVIQLERRNQERLRQTNFLLFLGELKAIQVEIGVLHEYHDMLEDPTEKEENMASIRETMSQLKDTRLETEQARRNEFESDPVVQRFVRSRITDSSSSDILTEEQGNEDTNTSRGASV